MKLEPLGKRIIAKQKVSEQSGMIILPPSSQRSELIAEVLEVGEDVVMVKPGDTIMFGKYATFNLPLRGEEFRDYIILNEPDVIVRIVD